MKYAWMLPAAVGALVLGGCLRAEQATQPQDTQHNAGPSNVSAYSQVGYGFSKFSAGKATDIAYGVNGKMYVIGYNGPGVSDHYIWYWDGDWYQMPGAAVRIAIEGDNTPWVVNSNHRIYRWNGSNWSLMPGLATDIAAGGSNIYMTGYENPQPQYGQKIWQWNGLGWSQIPGNGVKIATDPSGNVVVVNSQNQEFRLSNGQWISLPGTAHDVAGNFGKTGTAGGVFHWDPYVSSWIGTQCYTNCLADALAYNPAAVKFAFTDADHDIYVEN